MPNFGQALAQGGAGAAAGMTFGGPIGAGVMGGLDFLGGLFGLGGPTEDPIARQQRQQQQQIQQQMLGYAKSVPGSAPDELANLAQARGDLGAQQRQVQQRAFANYNPSQGLPASQMLANLGNTQIAQQMALSSGMLQNASANRRQALMDAANVGTSAANMYRPIPSQFGQASAQLMQQLAYQQARNQGGAGAGAAAAGAGAQPTSTSFGGVPVAIPPAGASATGPDSFSAPVADASVQGLTGGPPGALPGGMTPEMLQQILPQILAMMAQQIGPQGLQGSLAPGNEAFGQNSTNNQVRQPMQMQGMPGATQPQFDPLQIQQMIAAGLFPSGAQMPSQ